MDFSLLEKHGGKGSWVHLYAHLYSGNLWVSPHVLGSWCKADKYGLLRLHQGKPFIFWGLFRSFQKVASRWPWDHCVQPAVLPHQSQRLCISKKISCRHAPTWNAPKILTDTNYAVSGDNVRAYLKARDFHWRDKRPEKIREITVKIILFSLETFKSVDGE